MTALTGERTTGNHAVRGIASRAASLRPFASREGFTLLEILVSLALMAIALVAIFELFSINMKGLSASDDYANAVIKAESVMREILDDEDLRENAWTENTDDGYTVDVVVSDTAGNRTENMPVKLLQINLKIGWTRGIKHRQLTLTTMKVVEKQI